MDDEKKALKGSSSRDEFKNLHKLRCNEHFYASDLDFVLVTGNRTIVAFLDYKTPNDQITWAEGIMFDNLLELAPVYIVVAPPEPLEGPFKISRYINRAVQQDEAILSTWDDFDDWEGELRRKHYEGLVDSGEVIELIHPVRPFEDE